MRDEVLRRQALAVAIVLGGLAAACGGAEPKPVTVELGAAGPAPSLVQAAPPKANARPERPEAPPIAWIASERDARELMKQSHQPMLVWARADWAAAALEMERKVWSDPQVARAAQGFVPLRLDLTEAEGDAALLAERYGIRAMPSTVILDATGQRVAVLEGYADAARVIAALAAAP